MMNKREFLKGGVASLVTGAGQTVALAALPAGLHERSGLAGWRPHVGRTFRVDGHPVALRDVTAMATQPGDEQFSLSFAGHLPEDMGDRLHILTTDSGEPVALYLARTDTGLRADFCRHTA